MAIINEQHTLTIKWQDYFVFISMLLVSAIIGIYFMIKDRRKQKLKSLENYLLAGREITSPFPPAMSLTASFMSAITVLGTPVEFYIYGVMYAWCMLGFLLVGILAAHFFLPVIFDLKLSTSYEYLKIRFGSKNLELAASVVYLLFCNRILDYPTAWVNAD